MPLVELKCREFVLIYEPACTDEVIKSVVELFCEKSTPMAPVEPS